MTRIDIASAVEEIVAGVADEHGLFGARDLITPESTLNDQLGMDEADIVEVIHRAENRFGLFARQWNWILFNARRCRRSNCSAFGR